MRDDLARRIAWPIWNRAERRPRALVRLLVHGLLLAIAGNGVHAALFVLPQWLGAPEPLLRSAFEPAFYGVLLFSVIVVTWACARFVDRRPFAALGLRPRRGYLMDVALGTVIGGLCMAAIAMIEDMLGLATFTPRAQGAEQLVALLPAIGSAFTTFVGIAILEELVSRGYHLTNLAEGLALSGGRRHAHAAIGALAISSVAFGVGHAGNPEATWVPVALIAVGGLFLACGFLTQGDLALPIGLHLGWNFFQNLLGMPVSGMRTLHDGALLARTEIGDDLLSGGDFGPEAGLTGLFGMLFGTVLALAWVKARTGRVRVVARFGVAPTRA